MVIWDHLHLVVEAIPKRILQASRTLADQCSKAQAILQSVLPYIWLLNCNRGILILILFKLFPQRQHTPLIFCGESRVSLNFTLHAAADSAKAHIMPMCCYQPDPWE